MMAASDNGNRFDAVPLELRDRPQWVVHSKKIPYRASDPAALASSTTPATWGSFERAVGALTVKGVDGIGYVFAADDEIAGIDLDRCRDPKTGALEPWAEEIIAHIASYTEVSPSRTGVHIFARAVLPGSGINRHVEGHKIELYDRGRYFTVTGEHLDGTPETIEERDDRVQALYYKVLAKGRSDENERRGSSVQPLLSDSEIIEKLLGEKTGKAARLWGGDTSGHDGDDSAADCALCAKILFYTDDDGQVERVFEQSSLCRAKWTERADYRRRTINAARAVAERGDRYTTRQAAGANGAQKATPSEEPGSGEDSRDTAPYDSLPCIIVNNRQLRETTADALDALQWANDPPVLFERDGAPVRIRVDERGRPVIQMVAKAMLRGRLTACADFITVRKTKDGPVEISVPPPLDVVEDVLALPVRPFPALEMIVETPVLRPDGTIVDRPGYDASTRVIYAPALGLEVPPIPERPGPADVGAAVALLDEAIGEFPYADEASRAGAYGPLVTSACRTAIGGPTPLALVDAPQQGTGKTLYAGVTAIVATGRDAAVLSPPDNDEELKKLITAELVEGGALFVFDNLDRPLWAPSLARAITASVWKDRILGRSEILTLPVRVTWLLTGNNVRLRGDIPRRSYWIRLDAKTARPWERTGFTHPDLLAWAKANRGRLVAAILTLARAWYVAGCPPPSSPSIGGFEEWSRVVGGILEHAGVRGFLGNLSEMYDEADEEAGQWEAFLEALRTHYPEGEFTVAEVVQRLTDGTNLREYLPDDLADFDPFGEPTKKSGFQRRLGKAFGKRAGTRYGTRGLHLERGGQRKKVVVWHVVYGKQTSDSSTNASSLSDKAGGLGVRGVLFQPSECGRDENLQVTGGGIKPPKPETPPSNQEPAICGNCGYPIHSCTCENPF